MTTTWQLDSSVVVLQICSSLGESEIFQANVLIKKRKKQSNTEKQYPLQPGSVLHNRTVYYTKYTVL